MKKLYILFLLFILLLPFNTKIFATEFDDTYCENEFNGEKLWKSEIKTQKFYGQN